MKQIPKPSKDELETINYKEEQLVEYENKVYYPIIIDIRKIANKKFKSSDDKQKKLDEVEKKI